MDHIRHVYLKPRHKKGQVMSRDLVKSKPVPSKALFVPRSRWWGGDLYVLLTYIRTNSLPPGGMFTDRYIRVQQP